VVGTEVLSGPTWELPTGGVEFHLSHIKCYSCSMCVTDTLSSEARCLWIKFVPFLRKTVKFSNICMLHRSHTRWQGTAEDMVEKFLLSIFSCNSFDFKNQINRQAMPRVSSICVYVFLLERFGVGLSCLAALLL